MGLSVVILAAGKGTRMRSSLPKVLHPVANTPMVQHVINAAKAVNADNINLIYGHGADVLKSTISDSELHWVEQAEQLGTGHAVIQSLPHLPDDHNVLILYGDVPLIKPSTLERLLNTQPENGIGLLTVVLDDPTGYGRIVRESGNVVGICEHKDAAGNDALLAIQEVNTGIMAVNAELLKTWLGRINNDNAQQEYYLTDIIALANEDGAPIVAAHPDSAVEVEGANDRVQLANLEREFQRRAAEALMREGASLLDPSRIDIRGSVTVGTDVVIDANVIFEGEVHLESGVHIEANCILRNCSIGAGSYLRSHTLVENSIVGENCTLGPFARLRPDSEMKNNSHVGNFVEMKKSTLGEGSKANHLSYIGDSEVGQKVNIGAGTITCNYDGANKHKTIIGDGAFIGSNSSLVAPITIGENATVGAGSTVSKQIEDDVLVVVRGKAVKKTGWKRPVKKAKD